MKKQVGGIKDSGQRRVYKSGAQRDRSHGKGRFDLNPAFAELFLARVMEDGAIKYKDRNWEIGFPISWYIDSAQRHLAKYKAGMRDEPHMSQALWNIACALTIASFVELGLRPEELFDLPNHCSAEKVRPLSKYELESLMSFVGRPIQKAEAEKFVKRLKDPRFHVQQKR